MAVAPGVMGIPHSWEARKRLHFIAGLLFGLAMGLLACEIRHWLDAE